MELLVSLVIGAAVALTTKALDLVKWSAAVLLFVLVSLVVFFGEIHIFLSILMIFSVLIIVDVIFSKKIHLVTSSVNKKSGARDFIQLFVNCFPAAALIVIYSFFPNPAVLSALFASLGEAVSDSMASDIGVLSKRQPISIINFKPVQRGMSGGITFLGTFSAFITAVLNSLICFLMLKCSIISALIIMLSAIFGVLLDSFLGAACQAKYYCDHCNKLTEKKFHCGYETRLISGIAWLDNCLVNFICNIAACGMAFVLTLYLG